MSRFYSPNLIVPILCALSICIPTRKARITKSKSFSSVASYIWNKLACHLLSIPTLPSINTFSIFVCLPRYFLTNAYLRFRDVTPSFINLAQVRYICRPSQLFLFLEELSNIIYSCLLIPDSSAKSGMIKPAQCISLRDTVPTTAIAQPVNTMPPIYNSVPSERLRLVKRFVSHRLRMGKSCVIYLLTSGRLAILL